MGRLTILAGIIVSCSLGVSAQNMNIDIKTTEQLMLNTASQKTIELLHNEKIQTIKQRQNKLMEMTAAYAGLKDVFMITLENAKGFGAESGIYKSIVITSLNIVSHAVSATNALTKSNLVGKTIAATRMYDLIVEAAHLGNMFFDIVGNAEVANPLTTKMPSAEAAQKDKYNLLNRHERLVMALKISVELKKIDRQLVMITYYCQNNTLSDLLLNIDRETWVTYHYANFSAKKLINSWNSLVN